MWVCNGPRLYSVPSMHHVTCVREVNLGYAPHVTNEPARDSELAVCPHNRRAMLPYGRGILLLLYSTSLSAARFSVAQSHPRERPRLAFFRFQSHPR